MTNQTFAGSGKPDGEITTAEAEERQLWGGVARVWHLAFAAVVVLVGTVLATDGDLPGGRRWLCLGLLAALSLWYGAVGVPVVNSPRAGYLYLAGLVVLSLLVFRYGDGSTQILMYIIYPQFFLVVENDRWAFGLVLGYTLAAGGATLLREGADDLGGTLVDIAVTVIFSLFMSSFIQALADQNHRRGQLIGELRRTQEELSAVSHDAGVLAERERLSREIHDTLAQGFTSVLMLVQAAQAVDDRAEVERLLALMERTTRDNLAEARSLVAALAPAELGGGLPDAVRRLADRFGDEVGVPSAVEVVGEPVELPAAHEVVLLRAAQEALSNARKHASPTKVRLRLDYRPDRTVLSIEDDGRGFDPSAADRGYGLAGMTARAGQVGGSMTVHSGREDGTTVTVEVPRW